MPSAPWLYPLLLPVGLVAPGWLLGRALGTPAGPAGALIGSAVILVNLVLALDALHLPIDLTHLATGLALICGLFAGIAAKHRAEPPPPPAPRGKFAWSRSHWLLVPTFAGLMAIAWRAWVEPLSGFDTFFRWDFLAREILRTGHLQFYPAVTASDFLHYSWVDGIAPLVSTVYLWAYCSLGDLATRATTPVVVAEAALLFWLVGQLATRRSGTIAGLVAMALLAINAWALWGIAMGQETGLTALGLVGMFYFLDRARDEPALRWPVWAGLAAGAGALAREYGLIFVALGWAAMAWQRTPRRGWIEFTLAATAVAAPWYLRNWIRTGNPLWSQSLGGLFPTNPMLADYFLSMGDVGNVVAHPSLLLLGATLLAIALVPILAGVVGAVRLRRETTPWIVACVVVVGLWLWSIGQTSGGVAYSVRVLEPAFALGAVLGGCWIARWITASRAPVLAVVFAGLAAEAAMHSLYLPVWPLEAWWRRELGSWLDFGAATVRWRRDANWKNIADAAEGRKILVSDPSCHTTLLERGAKPVPFFSPEVAFLFGPGPELATRAARLRDLGFRFILITRGNSIVDVQTARHPFFAALQSNRPAGTTWLYYVYDLYSIGPLTAPAAADPIHAR